MSSPLSSGKLDDGGMKFSWSSSRAQVACPPVFANRVMLPCHWMFGTYGDHHDVFRRAAENLIIGWLRSKVVQRVWLGTPCSSWSRARRGPPGSGWRTMRDSSNLMGLPNLTDRRVTRLASVSEIGF